MKDEEAWVGKSKEVWGVISGISTEGWEGMTREKQKRMRSY